MVRFPQEACLFSRTSQPFLKPKDSASRFVTKALCQAYNGKSVNLTTHFHSVPKLRILGALTALLPYATMPSTGTTVPLLLREIKTSVQLIYFGSRYTQNFTAFEAEEITFLL